MSEDDKTRAAAKGIKFSEFQQISNQEGNPMEVVGLRDGENVRAVLTTDLVATEPEVVFRNSKGQFAAVDPGLLLLDNQLKVNRYFYNWMLEQGVTIDPAPPVTPADGALWFDNSADVMQLFMWHEESDAWLPVAPPTTLEGRVEAGETTQAAIIEQIQKSLEDQAGLADRITAGEAEQATLKNKVNALEGVIGEYSLVFTMDNSNPRGGEFNLKDGAMQVTNTLASADYITLSDTDRNGNAINLDRITEGDVLRFSSVDGQAAELKITDGTNGFFAFTKVSGELDRLSDMPYQFILLSSFDPTGLATVDYVDAQDDKKLNLTGGTLTGKVNFLGDNGVQIDIKNGNTKIWASGAVQTTYTQFKDDELVTKQYVDDKVAAIPAPEASGPAPLLWKYNPNVPADSLGNGEFNLSADLESGSASDWSIFFSNRDARGQLWFPSYSGDSYTHEVADALATIRDRDAIVCHGKTNKWYFNEGSNNYVKLRLSYYKKQFSMANGKYYLISVPGYMPFFPYSNDAYSNGTHG